MNVLIVGRKAVGTCDLSGKKNVEVWLLKAGSGKVQQVANNRLLECLRMLTSVGNDSLSPTEEKKP